MQLSFPYPATIKTGGYNELLAPDGTVRPHWRNFFGALEKDGPEKLSFYAEQTARLMSADIMSASAKDRVKHGVIPFILPQEDFEKIAAGLIQRAELINLMLADLYGEQRLITKGVLPPAVVFGNPSYLPALKNIRPAGNVFLQEYAADIERSPDGRFWVVGDKTQIPEGIALTIKNRIVMSRVMPDIYTQASPARIFDFFDAVRRNLFSIASKRDAAKVPSVVLLNSTADKPLSFEESFLARSLGISAVDPADLTVRGTSVYLKNIDGLKQVDVILRRIDDSLCDPLELKGSSLFGIAGLVEAVRSGSVAVINPLGTGLAEIPALKAFIHGIAGFFGKDGLMLPSIAAWWCGQPQEKEYVLTHLDALQVFDAATGKEARASKEDIEKHPESFVARERVNASMTPVLHGGEIVPARTRLRFHLIYENGSYRILNGGLAFTDTGTATGLCDVWIPSPDKKETARTMPASASKPVRTTFELTSRIAENMFWLGRNLERSEQLARLLRIAVGRTTEGPETPEPNDVATLLSVLALSGYLPFRDFQDPAERREALDGLRDIISSADYGFGLHALFSRLREMADMLHDRLSIETWELFTQLTPLLPERKSNFQIILNRLNAVILRQNALSGLIRENMTRDHSWRFMEIGRRLERGVQILNLLSGIDSCTRSGFNASLETILETSDSRMTYRVRYMAVPTVPLVFDLLVCDATNPRALIYQVMKLRQNISVLEAESRIPGLFSKEMLILEKMIEDIRKIDVMSLAEQMKSLNETVAVHPAFNTILSEQRSRLQEFSDTLTLSCFVHAASTRQGPSYSKGKIK